jgi:hypothetical protein
MSQMCQKRKFSYAFVVVSGWAVCVHALQFRGAKTANLFDAVFMPSSVMRRVANPSHAFEPIT